MISALKRRARKAQAVARDPAARFARDLAVQPPTKGVASVKAASDVYEAARQGEERSAHASDAAPPDADK